MTTQTARNGDVLDQLLDPLRDALTPDAARAIANLRADAKTQALLDDLAERHHEGRLSPEELADYQSLAAGINLISVFQAEARLALGRSA